MSELLHLIITGSITALYYFKINWCSAALTFPTSASIVKNQSLQQLNFFFRAFNTFLLVWIWVQDLYKNVIFFPPRLPFLLKPHCNFKFEVTNKWRSRIFCAFDVFNPENFIFFNPVNLRTSWFLKDSSYFSLVLYRNGKKNSMNF